MKATLLRRAAAWVAALIFLLPCVPALAGHDVVIPFPEELTIRMETESWTAADAPSRPGGNLAGASGPFLPG